MPFAPKAQKGIDKGKKSTRFLERYILGWKYTWASKWTGNRNWIRAQFTNCFIHCSSRWICSTPSALIRAVAMGNPAKLWFMVCNQITARGACPGVGLSTVMKYDNCFWQIRRNYLNILNQVLERWAEDVKRSYCMNTEHLFIIC